MNVHPMDWKWVLITISINILFSMMGYIVSIRVIDKMKHMFIKANIFGIDMNKSISHNRNSLKGESTCSGQIKMLANIV